MQAACPHAALSRASPITLQERESLIDATEVGECSTFGKAINLAMAKAAPAGRLAARVVCNALRAAGM
jgi:hypothetical protein